MIKTKEWEYSKMSRLQKYLNEDKGKAIGYNELVVREFKSFYPDIEKDCKPYITEFKKSKSLRFLYRGTERKISDFRILKSYIKTGRQPKDTPEELHNLLNDLFSDKFRWNVRDGVSTSSGTSTAGYGTTYLFFPIGRYEYAWSPDIDDLWTEIEQESNFEEPEPDLGVVEDEYDEEYGEYQSGHWEYDGEVIDDPTDVQVDLEDKGELFDEMLIQWVPDVELDDYIEQKARHYVDDRENFLYRLVKTYTDMGLFKAIKSKHEVLFNCKKYYLVNKDYEDLFAEVLIGNTKIEDL